jgi:mono/diheme cytochrome c family protein
MISEFNSRRRALRRLLPPLSAAIVVAGLALTLASLGAAEKQTNKVDVAKLPAPADKKVDFEKDIKPVLKKSCFDCHGPYMQLGNFRLDLRDPALKGGEKGIAIVPGKSAESPLIHYVARLVKTMEMPPEDNNDVLTKEQIALLRAWIDQGAKW